MFLRVTSRDLCLVASILGYMVQRGLSPGPFFLFANGNGLSGPVLYPLCGQLSTRSARTPPSTRATVSASGQPRQQPNMVSPIL